MSSFEGSCVYRCSRFATVRAWSASHLFSVKVSWPIISTDSTIITRHLISSRLVSEIYVGSTGVFLSGGIEIEIISTVLTVPENRFTSGPNTSGEYPLAILKVRDKVWLLLSCIVRDHLQKTGFEPLAFSPRPRRYLWLTRHTVKSNSSAGDNRTAALIMPFAEGLPSLNAGLGSKKYFKTPN